MSGFATIDGRISPTVEDGVKVLIEQHLDTKYKTKKAIAMNKIEIETIKSRQRQLWENVEELRGVMRGIHEANNARIVGPDGRNSPSGGKRKKKKRKRTRKKRKN